jgi:hypothetical protein
LWQKEIAEHQDEEECDN